MRPRMAKGMRAACAAVIGLAMGFTTSVLFLSAADAQPPFRDVDQTQDTPLAAGSEYRVFGFNDLGMHCYDHNFSVLSILPLFNVLRAQVVRVGSLPQVLTKNQVAVFYKAYEDSTGSINTTSDGKTNFWDFAGQLYGAQNLPIDQGLLGAKMPGPLNRKQRLATFDPSARWFEASGIPITSYDDAGLKNPYPLMTVLAVDKTTNQVAATLPAVLPVSDEMNCSNCHATGRMAAKINGIPWSQAQDPFVQYAENILLLHDFFNETTLFADKPVLCASCHYSKALDLNGSGPPPNGLPFLSHAIHSYHAIIVPADPPGEPKSCYSCHPGTVTRCLRGVMATSGLICSDCHGTMAAVGSSSREPWVDQPKCQSCHTGDAVKHLGANIRFRIAYDNHPSIATPRMASNKRFAENSDPLDPKKALLYRNSLGHGGLACEACHGSPHAEWPTRELNDNRASLRLQGYEGKIMECKVCHGNQQPKNIRGPHGLHNVNNRRWVNGHEGFFGTGTRCKRCHGLTGQGTVLSRTPVARTFNLQSSNETVTIPADTRINCGLCHTNPLGGP